MTLPANEHTSYLLKMKVAPICLLNKADQFYSEIDYLRFDQNLQLLGADPLIKKAVKLTILEYLKIQPYSSFNNFLQDTSFTKTLGEET